MRQVAARDDSVSNAGAAHWQDLVAALQAATSGGESEVVPVPELQGAMVVRCCVDVCVNVTPIGIHVECWHRFGTDPYKVLSLERIDDAVHAVLAELDEE